MVYVCPSHPSISRRRKRKRRRNDMISILTNKNKNYYLKNKLKYQSKERVFRIKLEIKFCNYFFQIDELIFFIRRDNFLYFAIFLLLAIKFIRYFLLSVNISFCVLNISSECQVKITFKIRSVSGVAGRWNPPLGWNIYHTRIYNNFISLLNY